MLQAGVRERGERADGDPPVAGLGRLAHDLLHLDRERREIAQPPGRPGCVVAALDRRLERDGAQQQPAGCGIRLAREGAAARRFERLRGVGGELPRRGAVELLEQGGGLVEVVGADLEQLLAGALAQPVGEALVEVRSRGLGEARVGDLANQHVLEAVGDFTRDR